MKKLLSIATIVLISSLSAAPAMHNGAMKKVHEINHANPMPNLMRVAIGNAEILNIDKKQMSALMAWSKENKPLMNKMVKDVMQKESEMEYSALTSGSNLEKLADSILETRREIMMKKIACRALLIKTLSAKQYAYLVNIYTTTR